MCIRDSYMGTAMIFYYMNGYVNTTDTSTKVIAWKALMFGVLLGSVNYMSGNVTKGTIDKVMLALGFNTHEYTNEEFLTITKAVTTSGVTTTTK